MSASDNTPLRLLVFGAGAIGTYVGGSLALDGHEVVFLEQAAVAGQLRQRGLRLKIDETERLIAEPNIAGSLPEALEGEPFDLAIFALKSFDTANALESMRPVREALPPILCLQNGVENESVLAGVLGKDKVIAGTVTSAIGRRAAGDIQLERLRGMGVAAGHPLSQRIASALNGAGLKARLYAHADEMKWSKMLTNLLANASSAILDMTPGEIFAHSGLFRLEIRQLKEALRVMSAQNIYSVDLPGTPVRALAFAVRSLPLSISKPILKQAVGGGRGGKMPSFHIDLYNGRGKSEVNYLNGAVVRYGEKLGVPTPANRLLNSTLLALTHGDIPLDTYKKQPEKLLALSSEV
jgi:2-dehydropantoate 2-reductase